MANEVLGARQPAGRASRALVLALAASREVARAVVVGEGPRLRSEAAAVLRHDVTAATEMLTAWCEATSDVTPQSLAGAVSRVVGIAASAGRTTELGAAVLHALLRTTRLRRSPWTEEWVNAMAPREDLVIARRMLRAATAATSGRDVTVLLALAVEEQRVVEDIVSGCRDPTATQLGDESGPLEA
jgi:hypothetical protein